MIGLVILVVGYAVWRHLKKKSLSVEIGRPDRFQYELGRVQEEESPAGGSVGDLRRIGEVETDSPSQDESRD